MCDRGQVTVTPKKSLAEQAVCEYNIMDIL